MVGAQRRLDSRITPATYPVKIGKKTASRKVIKTRCDMTRLMTAQSNVLPDVSDELV